jgi:hypothetical protein
VCNCKPIIIKSNTYSVEREYEATLSVLARSFDNEFAEQADNLRAEEGQIRNLERNVKVVADDLHKVLFRSMKQMSDHDGRASDRLARVEGAVEKLTAKIHEVCEFIGIPSDHVPSICGRPAFFPSAEVHWLGYEEREVRPASAPPTFDTQPVSTPRPESPGLEYVPEGRPASADSSSASITSASPHSAPVSPSTVLAALVEQQAAAPLQHTAATMEMPTTASNQTHSRSHSRSLASATLEVPDTVRMACSSSNSQSGMSNMEVDEERRGHKRKASDTNAGREGTRQRK